MKYTLEWVTDHHNVNHDELYIVFDYMDFRDVDKDDHNDLLCAWWNKQEERYEVGVGPSSTFEDSMVVPVYQQEDETMAAFLERVEAITELELTDWQDFIGGQYELYE